MNSIEELEEAFGAQAFKKFPLAIVRGKGSLVWDADGKEYVDCMGGYGVCLVGHCHPKVVEAIKEQANRMITCHGSFYNDARAEMISKLAGVMPESLNSFLLVNSGTESVECALKVARIPKAAATTTTAPVPARTSLR
jgi:acetylornithine/LysW-gamma-L-lysine aminotransferase